MTCQAQSRVSSVSSPGHTHPLPGPGCRAWVARHLWLWLARDHPSCQPPSGGSPPRAERDKDMRFSHKTFQRHCQVTRLHSSRLHVGEQGVSQGFPSSTFWDKRPQNVYRWSRLLLERKQAFPLRLGSGLLLQSHTDGGRSRQSQKPWLEPQGLPGPRMMADEKPPRHRTTLSLGRRQNPHVQEVPGGSVGPSHCVYLHVRCAT